MYYDAALDLVFVNFVPGWAYLWFGLWLFVVAVLSSLGVAQRNLIFLALAVLAALYWLLWLNVPLIGYSWFFVWDFVDLVVDESLEQGRSRELPAAFSYEAAAQLGMPFKLTVYAGLLLVCRRVRLHRHHAAHLACGRSRLSGGDRRSASRRARRTPRQIARLGSLGRIGRGPGRILWSAAHGSGAGCGAGRLQRGRRGRRDLLTC